MSQRDDFLSRCAVRRKAVDCPEWGRTVWVRSLGAADVAELMDALGLFEGAAAEADQAQAVEVTITGLCARGRLYWVLARAVCDEAGNLLFTPEDEGSLAGGNPAVLLRLAGEAVKLSFREFSEGAEGNSNGAPSGASSTGSASPSVSATPTTSDSPPASSGTGSPSPPSNPSETCVQMRA